MQRLLRFGLVGALILATGLGGCATATAPEAASDERVVVRLSGSGTCMPLLKLLTGEYGEEGTDWRYLPGLHTGGGIQGVKNGELEIGAISRPMTDEELALGLVHTPLSDDGIVIAVHPSVTIDGLTTQQVRDIYSGVYENWSQLGGPDLSITILDRNEDESAKMILRQYVLGSDLVVSPKAVSLYYEIDIINGLQSTAGAIGYFSLGYGISEDIPVTFLALDGVEATVENINNGTYAMVRPLGVVTSPDAAPEIVAFLEWAASGEVAALMEENGYTAAR